MMEPDPHQLLPDPAQAEKPQPLAPRNHEAKLAPRLASVMRSYSFFWFVVMGFFHYHLTHLLLDYVLRRNHLHAAYTPSTVTSVENFLRIWSPFSPWVLSGKLGYHFLTVSSVVAGIAGGFVGKLRPAGVTSALPPRLRVLRWVIRAAAIACGVFSMKIWLPRVYDGEWVPSLREHLALNPYIQSAKRTTDFTVYEDPVQEKLSHHPKLQEIIQEQQPIPFGPPFFPEQPLTLSKHDRPKLRTSIINRNFYAANLGPKPCRGDAPDRLILWKDGSRTYAFLVCLSCQEVVAYNGQSAFKVHLLRDSRNYVKARFTP